MIECTIIKIRCNTKLLTSKKEKKKYWTHKKDFIIRKHNILYMYEYIIETNILYMCINNYDKYWCMNSSSQKIKTEDEKINPALWCYETHLRGHK